MVDELRFFFPIIRPDDASSCIHCEACKHACTVYAISATTTGVTVNRDACLKTVMMKNGECLECIMACKRSILSLVQFKKNKEGTIIQE